MYWNLIINFDWNIIEIEIAKYKHSTELSCNITTLPVGLSDTQIGVCREYVFMYGLRRLSRERSFAELDQCLTLIVSQ